MATKPTLTFEQAEAAREVKKTITDDNSRMMAVYKVITKGYTGDLAILNTTDPNTLDLFWKDETNVEVIGDLGIDWNDFSVMFSASKLRIVIGKTADDTGYIHESPDMTSKVLEEVGKYMANQAIGASQINYQLSNGDTLIYRKKGYSGI